MATRRLSGAPVPLRIDWLPPSVSIVGQRESAVMPAEQPLLLEPQTSITWTLQVRRADAMPFASERYVFQISVAPTNAFSESDGRPIAGPLLWTLRSTYTFRRPRLPTKRAMFRMMAEQAFRAGEWSDAVEWFTRAVAAKPTDDSLKVLLSGTYVVLGRYEEAKKTLEDVWTRSRDRMVALFLAISYVGLGDVQSASNVLRAARMSEDEVQTELMRLRKSVQSRGR